MLGKVLETVDCGLDKPIDGFWLGSKLCTREGGYAGFRNVGLNDGSDNGITLVVSVGEAIGVEVETSEGRKEPGVTVGIGLLHRPQLKSQIGD